MRHSGLVAFLVFAIAAVALPACAAIFGPGTSRVAPVAASAAAPNRQALIIIPALAGGGDNPRGALAQSDALAYRDLLRLLGFAVTIVAVDTRPGLDSASRDFAGRVQHDADVAVFVLGAAIAAQGKLYVPASDLSAAQRTPDRIATESIDMAEILRRIQDHGPRELVAIVDECGGGAPNPTCTIGPGTVPDGASAIVARRVTGDGGAPLAGVATIRQDLLPLMKEPDLSFLKLFSRLKERLDGTNVGLTTTPALSRNFTFLPGEFFQKLPTECNKADAGTSAETLRGMASVAPLVTACERAAETWAFASLFKEKLATAREQLAFQKAVASCDNRAAAAYLDAYPSGSYRFPVSEYVTQCDRARQPPPPPPPPPVAPPPVAQEPSLQDQASAAVTTYYDKHSYSDGDDLSAAASLYPRAFNRSGTVKSREGHIAELRRYYSRLTSFAIRPVPGSMDFSECLRSENCLVRGTAEATFQKLGEGDTKTSRSRFSIRFDLNRPIKVLYECSVVRPRVDPPCE